MVKLSDICHKTLVNLYHVYHKTHHPTYSSALSSNISQKIKRYKIMKRQFKRWWSTIPLVSTKWAKTSHLNSLNTKTITRTYDVVFSYCLDRNCACNDVKVG